MPGRQKFGHYIRMKYFGCFIMVGSVVQAIKPVYLNTTPDNSGCTNAATSMLATLRLSKS